MVYTILIYIDDDYGVKFFNLEGDFSRFDNVFINGEDVELGIELNDLLYNKDGTFKQTVFDKFPVESVSKETKVIVCG